MNHDASPTFMLKIINFCLILDFLFAVSIVYITIGNYRYCKKKIENQARYGDVIHKSSTGHVDFTLYKKVNSTLYLA